MVPKINTCACTYTSSDIHVFTLMCLAASGLKRGVLQYCKNSVAILFLNP